MRLGRIICWIVGHDWCEKTKNLGTLGPPPFGPDPRLFSYKGKFYDLTKSELRYNFKWCKRCEEEPWAFVPNEQVKQRLEPLLPTWDIHAN